MESGLNKNIFPEEIRNRIAVKSPENTDFCRNLKNSTIARVCIGRAGARLKTETFLQLKADHAMAVDAVWSEVDEQTIDSLGLYKIKTRVASKEEYLKRPDLGRKLSNETILQIKRDCIKNPQVQIIVADGLSATAIDHNLSDLYPALCDGLHDYGYRLGTPFFVRYGRVAVMDQISEALNAVVTVLLVGERPGLAVADSLGCYMAYRSSSQKPESQRTVISNIHARGTPPVEAGAQIADVVKIIMEKKQSGVDLKLN